jgi:hypothetical protein
MRSPSNTLRAIAEAHNGLFLHGDPVALRLTRRAACHGSSLTVHCAAPLNHPRLTCKFSRPLPPCQRLAF